MHKSLDNLKNWLLEFIDQADIREPDSFPIAIVGNKIDSEQDRCVSRKQGLDVARKLKALCLKVAKQRARDAFNAELAEEASGLRTSDSEVVSPLPTELQSPIPTTGPGLGISQRGKGRVFGAVDAVDEDKAPVQGTKIEDEKDSHFFASSNISQSPKVSNLITNLTFKTGYSASQNEAEPLKPPASLFELAGEAQNQQTKAVKINDTRPSVQTDAKLTRRSSIISHYTTASEFSFEGDSEKGRIPGSDDEDDGIWTAGDRELEVLSSTFQPTKERSRKGSTDTLKAPVLDKTVQAEEDVSTEELSDGTDTGSQNTQANQITNAPNTSSSSSTLVSTTSAFSAEQNDIATKENHRPQQAVLRKIIRERTASFSPFEFTADGFPLYESSAKLGLCIDEAFEYVAYSIKPPRLNFELATDTVDLEDSWGELRSTGRSCAC
ncbi:hypothetical protein HDU96_011025 [Phlyctochytrium bullatum]|nr:hypothetical protein HDU96_011025 [Phlyctochytrium bullatum]